MVDFRPIPGRERENCGLGDNLTLLVVEYNGTSATDVDGLPVHYFDVQVAMFDGVNDHLRPQSNAHLKFDAMRPGGSGNPLVGYSSDQMIEIITAAWQQDDLMGECTALSDVTEQNVHGRDGSLVGTVYVVQADVSTGHGGLVPKIVPGSVSKADESLIPRAVMAEQYESCAKAWATEAPQRAADLASAEGRSPAQGTVQGDSGQTPSM